VVERAHAAGAWVEAELGALAGDEDSSGDVEVGAMTDPDQAAEFAARTGVDALAVAVGNVHGFTPKPVRLDLERLRAIAAKTPVPLVLHGASGLPEDDLLGAVGAGVVKVNINAELRRAHLTALAAGMPEAGDDVRALQHRAIEAMAKVAAEKITLLAGV
jgi:fructose-bisphosphate aldolase class II/tagatose 1,6-diphosphate aldolase GatY/KbaY